MNSLSFINKPFFIIKPFSLYKNKLQLSLFNNNNDKNKTKIYKIKYDNFYNPNNENFRFEINKRINRISIYLMLIIIIKMYVYLFFNYI